MSVPILRGQNMGRRWWRERQPMEIHAPSSRQTRLNVRISA
uniref:Uncharacterized protein n=1 Tax=Anguilla anguilla TaxID=7936 RepID=A0A0E9R0E1_ANGAN